MTVVASRPLASFVVEWENARLSEQSRAAALLRTLRRQSEEAAARLGARSPRTAGVPRFELLIVHDDAEFRGADLAHLMRSCLGESDEVLTWRLLATRTGGYYENKNLGASQANGDNLIFVDSDVIPEPGWLNELLRGLEDPIVEVLAGNTYIEPTGLIGKVFALTWFFPLRSEDGPVRLADSFFANNLAVRRAVHRSHPFPRLEGTSRGSCLLLADEFAAAGISTVLNPRARAGHPAPNGFRHFVLRALAQGRDRVHRERHLGSRPPFSWLASFVRLGRHVAGGVGKVCTRFHQIGLHPLWIPAACAVAGFYYLLFWIGEILTHAGVTAIQRVRV